MSDPISRPFLHESWIGQKVRKTSGNNNTKQPRPFKSGRKFNTVKGLVQHPTLNIPAFTFEEDDSIVECRRCILVAMS
jgi:hypothetical protein